jgi:hypothetical protein
MSAQLDRPSLSPSERAPRPPAGRRPAARSSLPNHSSRRHPGAPLGLAASGRPPPTGRLPLSVGPSSFDGLPPGSPSVDADPGLGLLFRFLISTSVAVAAFMLAVAVDEMWILVPVMAVHLFVTFVVLKGIFNLLKD